MLDHIPGIDTARAYQLAFPAHHTFDNFFSKTFRFTSLNQQVDFPGIKVGQPGSRTGCSATSTTNTPAMYYIREFLVWFDHNGFYRTHSYAGVTGFAFIVIYIYKR